MTLAGPVAAGTVFKMRYVKEKRRERDGTCLLCAVCCVLCTVYCVLCTVYCVLCTVYCNEY
jgi:hypothetical protein